MSGDTALSVRGAGLRAGAFRLRDVSLEVASGECLVLLGPTGAGKSLLVELLCGLRTCQAGSVHIGPRDVTHLDPAHRGIGYVPQDYALMPFQTVRENVAFGLRARKLPARQRDARVAEMLALLRIEHLADRWPRHLSGGERQRVALGRALVTRPDVLLLDEPFSALDEGTAGDLMDELLRLRRRFAITTVHICHVLEEALRLGDRLALMRQGSIVQTGTPAELFARPRDLFVAHLLRMRTLLAGQVRQEAGQRWFCVGSRRLARTDLPAGVAHGVVEPQRISVTHTPPPADEARAVFRATVLPNPCALLRSELCLGGELTLTVPGAFPANRWPAGKQVYVAFPLAAVHAIAADDAVPADSGL